MYIMLQKSVNKQHWQLKWGMCTLPKKRKPVLETTARCCQKRRFYFKSHGRIYSTALLAQASPPSPQHRCGRLGLGQQNGPWSRSNSWILSTGIWGYLKKFAGNGNQDKFILGARNCWSPCKEEFIKKFPRNAYNEKACVWISAFLCTQMNLIF